METLVLVHGLGADRHMWLRQLDRLTQKYHVFNPDLPGFGGEPAFADSTGQTLEGLADWLASEIYTRKLGKVHLAGYSMGGTVAMLTALQHPGAVQSLSLLCTSALWADGLRRFVAPVTRVPALGRTVFALMQANLARTVRRWCGPEEQEVLREMLQAADPARMTAHLDQLLRADLTGALERLAVPTLVAAGALDRLAPPSHARRLVRGLPNATLQVHPRADHFFCVSHPDALTNMICEHVDAHPASAGHERKG